MIKPQKSHTIPSSTDSGFTIIESLVAIVIATILLAAITPVIVLSTATRIQSRRVEQATQAAKTYTEAVRTKTIALPTKLIGIQAITTEKPRLIEHNLITTANFPVPKYPKDVSDNLYCFSKNGTIIPPPCDSDLFYIQAAQLKVIGRSSEEGYRLGIRIYREEAFNSQNTGNLLASDANSTDKSKHKLQQTTFTGGVGNSKKPLLEMTTDINSENTSFGSLCERLGVKQGTCK
jgi:prepilin-type N-terminal cleavage/methylation domain-containing protein